MLDRGAVPVHDNAHQTRTGADDQRLRPMRLSARMADAGRSNGQRQHQGCI